MSGLIVLFWFVAGGVALRYFVRFSQSLPLSKTDYMRQVLFIGVMSCMYVLWDVIGTYLATVCALCGVDPVGIR